MAGNIVSIVVKAKDEASKTLGDIESKTHKLGSALGDVAKIAGGFVLAQGILKAPSAIGGFVSSASDLNETLSKSNTIFKDNGKEIEDWASQAATDFGQSKQAALEAAGTFGNLFTQLGIGTQPAADMSQAMTELASDFASFHNADITSVIEAQTAAFRGEYDALQRYVPTINAAAVGQKAMEMTGKDTTAALTEQDKALAVHALMLEGAGEAAGDFDRTSGGLANQQRILSAEWANAQTQLGTLLLPALTDLAVLMTGTVIPAIKQFVDDAAPVIKEFAQNVKTAWESDIKPALDNLVKAWQELQPVIGPLIDQIILVVETMARTIALSLGIIIDLLGGDFSGAWNKTKELIDVVTNYWKDTIANAAELIRGLFGLFKSVGQDLIFAIRDGAQEWLTSTVLPWFASIPGKLVSAIKEGLSDLYNAGADLMKEFVKGMLSVNIPSPLDIAKGIGGAISSGAGAVFGSGGSGSIVTEYAAGDEYPGAYIGTPQVNVNIYGPSAAQLGADLAVDSRMVIR